MRRPEGVTIIAVYHFIISLPLVIGACAIVGVPISGALQYADDVGRFWALFGLGLAFLTVFGFALVGIVAGWGLLRLKSWARWLTVILAVLSLPLFPIGTVIGAVIIWYLLQDHVRLAFETGGAAPAPEAAEPITAVSVPVEEVPAVDPPADDSLEEDLLEEDPPYVIPPELDPESTEATMLDAVEVEEVAGEADATLVSVDDAEAQTLIAEVQEAADKAEDEEEAAAPETIILSEEELAEAQEDDEASEDEGEEDDETA